MKDRYLTGMRISGFVKRKMMQWFRNVISKCRILANSIFWRFLSLVIVLLFCITCSYLVMNYGVKALIRRNTEISNEKILQQINMKTVEFHNSMYSILTLLSYEQTIYDYYTQTPAEQVNAYKGLSSLLSNMMMTQNGIVGIALYDERLNKLAEIGKDPGLISKVKMVNKLSYSDVFRPNSSSDAYFMVSYPVYDLLNGNYDKQLGMIVVLMRAQKFASYMKDTEITEREELYLLDSGNTVISSGRGREYRRLREEELVSTDEVFVSVVEQKETGWKIVSIMPTDDLYRGMPIVRSFILVISLIMFGILAVLLWFCYYIVIRPIRNLTLFVKNSVANPVWRMKVEGSDEISMLADNLNHMLDERDEMGEKLRQAQRILYETELAKQQIQVLAYRNQINPHFLYNTFECIRAMALCYDAEEIAEITMALSKIFRYAIKGENVVTVEDEITNIQEYAKIIHYRFGGRIEVEIDLQKEARGLKIIKLILQPIVENAIFHGLEQKLEEGKVRVRVWRTGLADLELTVEDNGCGIEQKRLEELLHQMKHRSLSSSSGKDSIGLSNIYQRLRLFYGERASLKIESRPGEGTRVEIFIPCGEEGEGHV